MPSPYLRRIHNYKWRNKHKNASGPVGQLVDVWNLWDDGSPDPITWKPGIEGLQMLIREAEESEVCIRALGGNWSLSKAAYCPDIMVNTKPLNTIDVGIRPQNLHPDAHGSASELVVAQCGAHVQELNDVLEDAGLALPTSGASDGQTIAGAVSTGTHGSARTVGSMQDYVKGIHLLAEDGESFFLERNSERIAGNGLLDALSVPHDNLRSDDELFNAALVSFGSFGIIHALVLKVEPLFSLEASLKRYDVGQLLPLLDNLNLAPLQLPRGSQVPHHFEVVFNPYATGPGEKGAYVRWMYKESGGSPRPVRSPSGGHRPGDSLLGVIGTLSSIVPGAIPGAVGSLIKSNLPEFQTRKHTPGYTFGPTGIRGRGTSTEMGFALRDIRQAVEIILAVAAEYPFAGVPALRYVRSSDALLAFTSHDPVTCTIEIQAVDTRRSLEAYRRIWIRLNEANIPYTFHWGQHLMQNADHYPRVYGSRLTRWLAAKDSFLSAQARETFANPLVRALNLT